MHTRAEDAHAVGVNARMAHSFRTGDAVHMQSGTIETWDRPGADHRRRGVASTGHWAGEQQYIVQLKGPTTRAAEDNVRRAGFRLDGYLPAHAFLTAASEARVPELEAVAGVRWVGRFLADDKFDPALAGLLEERRRGDERVTLRVQLTPAAVFASAYTAADVEREWSVGTAVARVVSERRAVVHVDAHAAPAMLRMLAEDARSRHVEEHRRPRLQNEWTSWIIQSYSSGHHPVWDAGVRGAGEVVTVCDTGVDEGHCFFHDDNVAVPYDTVDFDHRKIVAYRRFVNDESGNPDGRDGHGHGTHVAGTVAGVVADASTASSTATLNSGMAPEAKLAFFDISAGSVGYLDSPYDLNGELFPWGYETAGSRVFSASWGEWGHIYSQASLDADQFAWDHRDWVGVFAAGNDGEMNTYGGLYQIVPPASAKNVLAVGASFSHPTDQLESLATYSSTGPLFDGRIKPDIVVPGDDINSALPASSAAAAGNNCMFTRRGGTSMAAPAVAGAAALVRQYFADGHYAGVPFSPTGALVKAVIVHSAHGMDGRQTKNSDAGGRWTADLVAESVPDIYQGYGLVKLDSVLLFPDLDAAAHGTPVNDDASLLPPTSLFAFNSTIDATDGDELDALARRRFCFRVAEGAERLRFTLTWFDAPPELTAAVAIVNNLDLIVSGPDARVHTANAAMFGEDADYINTVERVDIAAPAPGNYAVTVSARAVVNGPQPFALVATGAFETDADDERSCARLACPDDCGGNGACVAGVCLCDSEWTGADCSHPVVELVPFASVADALAGAQAEYAVPDFQWRHFAIELGSDEETAALLLSRTSGAGDVDVYIRRDDVPTLQDYHIADLRADADIQVDIASLAVTRGDAFDGSMRGRWFIGLYGTCCNDEDTRVTVATVAFPCPASCPVHAACVRNACACEPGWTGDECDEVVVERACESSAIGCPTPSSGAAHAAPALLAVLLSLVLAL